MLAVPLDESLLLAAAIMAGGVVAGLLAGLFGVGGGVVAVPVLYEVFRLLGVPDAVHMQLCIGTSLAIMAPSNIRSYLTHRATGAVLMDVVWQWTPGVIHQAVATSAGIVVPIALAGTLGYIAAGLPHQVQLPPLSIGFVSLIGFALMAPVSSVTASYGARMAHALSRRALEVAFGLFLLAASLRFLASLVWREWASDRIREGGRKRIDGVSAVSAVNPHVCPRPSPTSPTFLRRSRSACSAPPESCPRTPRPSR
jgi:uncharacterized membrane protein YfcA